MGLGFALVAIAALILRGGRVLELSRGGAGGYALGEIAGLVGKTDDQTPIVGAVTRALGSGKILSVACQDGLAGVLTTTDQPITDEHVDVTYQVDGGAKTTETWAHISGRIPIVGDAARPNRPLPQGNGGNYGSSGEWPSDRVFG